MVRSFAINGGRVVLAGLDRLVKAKAPALHQFIDVAVKAIRQEKLKDGYQEHRTEPPRHQ
jgi:hypothetical protein